jgi:hypothetical protein
MDISWFHVIIIFGELFLGFCKPKFILFFFPIIFKFSPTPPNPPPPLFIYLFFTRGRAGGPVQAGRRLSELANSLPTVARDALVCFLAAAAMEGGRSDGGATAQERKRARRLYNREWCVFSLSMLWYFTSQNGGSRCKD